MICTVLALAIAAATLSPAGSLASAAETSTPVSPTSVRTISPLDPQGHPAPAYRVTHRYGNANCESGSPATGTAYECFTPEAPQGIFEACWVDANPAFVTCLDKPWQRDVVRLRVTRDYDNTAGFPRVHRPWGVRLGSDTRCLVDLGSVHSADGHPISYRCNHKTILTGPVDRHGHTWRVTAYRRIAHKGHPLRFRSLGREPVAVAWLGKPSRTG
jgi:hypothetical protein